MAWRRFNRPIIIIPVIIIFIPLLCVISLRWINPLTSSVMLQQNIQSLFNENIEWSDYRWRDWNEVSPQFLLAVIASEDQRFPGHFGIDFTELKNAMGDKKGKRRGASTITQQVAKNLFLWRGRSYVRKAIEAGLSLLIELTWSKQRILEVYVNIAQMGESFYGIGAASEIYFGKSARQINRYEAARIAAILPNPSRYSAKYSSQYVVDRQQWILGQMKQLGGLQYLEKLD